MESQTDSVKDQLRNSGAAFSVKYIGFIEVATPFHEVVLGEKRIALCNGCASLIAQAAGLIPKESIDPETEELIGANEPKFFNKEIELTITNKVMTLFSTDDRKLLKKVEIANISIAVGVTVGDTLKNGFVFIGKTKTKTNELKRFCFLLQSQENPENIYFAINVAFSMCDQASNNNKNGSAAINGTTAQQPTANEDAIFKKPYLPPPRENDVLSYLNMGDKSGDISTLMRVKVGKPRPHLDPDIKSYPGPFPDFIPNAAKVYKASDGERMFRKPEDKKGLLSDDVALGDLYRKSPSTNASIYTNVFPDNLATSLFATVNTHSDTTCTKERFEQICEDIEKLPYFFGRITREAAHNYLKYDGSYLIRISETRPRTVILSVRQGKDVHHILLNDKNGNVTSDSCYFISIFHLMAFHTRKNLPFTTEGANAIKVYIKHPTPHPQKPI